VHTRPLLLAVALCLAAPAAAETPAPLTVPDLVGARTLALQAGIGNAGGTESLFLNPAAIAARKRYTVDAFYLTDRRPGLTDSARQQDAFGAAVVDSVSTPMAAGLAYARLLKGVETGTLLRLALGGQLSQGLSAGLQGNYFDLRGVDRVASAFNVDAGLFYQVTSQVSVGGSAYNLLTSKHRDLLPRGYGLGATVGPETSLHFVGDWRVDRDRARDAAGNTKTAYRYGVGAEYLLSGSVPVRGGYQVDDVLKTRWWALGLGYVSSRMAVDVGYRQSVKDASARTFELSLKVFVPNE